TGTPNSSALRQNGSYFSDDGTSPLMLPPTEAPFSPNVFTAYSNCSAARSGCWIDGEVNPTKRSECALHHSATPSSCTRTILAAKSRLAPYHQYWLMLTTCMSM